MRTTGVIGHKIVKADCRRRAELVDYLELDNGVRLIRVISRRILATTNTVFGSIMRSLHNVFRRIRRRASKLGYCLRSFRQIHGWNTDLGPEWQANCIRHPHLAVTIWRPTGDDAIKEANRTCDEVIVIKRFSNGRPWEAYGISWHR